MTNTTHPHEIVAVFAAHGMPLCDNLVEMLSEHHSHCTERRGSGYTQASRVLASYINTPRQHANFDDLKVFAEPPIKALEWLLRQVDAQEMQLNEWRNLDERTEVGRLTLDVEFHAELRAQTQWQHSLRAITDELILEESQLLVQMLVDLILPRDPIHEKLSNLTAATAKPAIGSCTFAEKFFLEIIHDAIPRKGRINIIVDEQEQPLLLEKINMGDSHSCLSLAPLMMHGVRMPAGSLFAAQVNEDNPPAVLRPCRRLKGDVIPVANYQGFRFLRLTTLAVSPANRARAFGAHFIRQADTGLFGYATARIDEFVTLARHQL